MKNSRSFAPALAALAVAATLAVACDFQKTQNQLTARSVMVATLLATPEVEIKPAALVVPDGGFALDAGVTFDGGSLLDAGVTIPPQTLVLVFFGQRQGDSLDAPPTGTTGATVSLVQTGGGSWPLTEQSGGNYLLLGADAGFTYVGKANYEFKVEHGGQTYVAELKESPDLENITQFHPAKGFTDLTAGSPFTFTRPDPPAGQDRNLGFVSVYPVDQQGQQGQPTWTNLPSAPLDFLKLVVTPIDWKTTTVTVPGTAFPDPEKTYIVLLQSAKLGGPQSDNLWTGSAIIGGTADVGVIRTH